MPPGKTNKRKQAPSTTQRLTRQTVRNNNVSQNDISDDENTTLTPDAFFQASPVVGSAGNRTTLPSNCWERVGVFSILR